MSNKRFAVASAAVAKAEARRLTAEYAAESLRNEQLREAIRGAEHGGLGDELAVGVEVQLEEDFINIISMAFIRAKLLNTAFTPKKCNAFLAAIIWRLVLNAGGKTSLIKLGYVGVNVGEIKIEQQRICAHKKGIQKC